MLAHYVLSVLLLAALARADAQIEEWDDSNFLEKLKEHKKVFVKFYAPWCGHCKKLAPTWVQLADELKDVLKVVKVDCAGSLATVTCAEYNVRGFPTLNLIIYNGDGSHKQNLVFAYDKGGRDLSSLSSFAKLHALPAVVEYNDEAKLKQVLDSGNKHALIAVVRDENSKLLKTLDKEGELLKYLMNLGWTTLEKPLVKHTSVDIKDAKEFFLLSRPKNLRVPVSKPSLAENDYEVLVSVEELDDFVKQGLLGKVTLRTEETDKLIKKPILTVFFKAALDEKPELYARVKKGLLERFYKQYGHKYSFALAEMVPFGELLYSLSLDYQNEDLFIAIEEDGGKKFRPEGKQYTEKQVDKMLDGVEAFLKEHNTNEMVPYEKSEPVPESNPGPVIVVVKKTFDEIVNDPSKDVMIEFYAPWCGHCKQLAPKYEELAKKLQGEKNLVIAKMDATANEVPEPYDVQGFPTIYFAPANNKQKPINYRGDRSVDAFIEFIDKNVHHKLVTVKDEL